MVSRSITDFIHYLNSLSENDFRTNCIDHYLASSRFETEDFAPFIYFRDDTYGRNLIFHTDLYELLVLTWLPGQHTPIHDHGGQRCWTIVQSGSLCFKNYRFPRNQKERLSPIGPVEIHEAGQRAYIDDGVGVHAISNTSKQPAISLHLYAKPVRECRIYDEKVKDFTWVELQYFTTPEQVFSSSF